MVLSRFVFCLSLILSIVTTDLLAQQSLITVKGKVSAQELIVGNRVMVINKATGRGSFAEPDGSFSYAIQKSDTLIISYTGYKTEKLCFRDSVYRKEYDVDIRLQKLFYSLKPVTVVPVKDLKTIQREIDELKKKRASEYGEYNTLGSPITALYERFSKFEQSKRFVAEMEAQERKAEILKDLFRVYIKYDIIYLDDEDFDEFVKFLDLPIEFIKGATQYELVEYIRYQYNQYVLARSRR